MIALPSSDAKPYRVKTVSVEHKKKLDADGALKNVFHRRFQLRSFDCSSVGCGYGSTF